MCRTPDPSPQGQTPAKQQRNGTAGSQHTSSEQHPAHQAQQVKLLLLRDSGCNSQVCGTMCLIPTLREAEKVGLSTLSNLVLGKRTQKNVPSDTVFNDPL